MFNINPKSILLLLSTTLLLILACAINWCIFLRQYGVLIMSIIIYYPPPQFSNTTISHNFSFSFLFLPPSLFPSSFSPSHPFFTFYSFLLLTTLHMGLPPNLISFCCTSILHHVFNTSFLHPSLQKNQKKHHKKKLFIGTIFIVFFL
eukprot:UN01973